MRGVFYPDQNGQAITDFFVNSVYENAFLCDSKGHVQLEFKQQIWRVFCGLGINQSDNLYDLALKYVKFTPPFKKRLEPQHHFRKLRLELDHDGSLMNTVENLARRSPPRANGLIMAGGFGRRLGDLTKNTPKPMLPIANKPIAHHLLDNLVDNGISRLFMSLHYLGETVKDYFQDGRKFGAQISYLEETAPLGTAGCLSLIEEELTQPLLIVNGDVVTDLQFSRLIDYHETTGADVTLSVGQRLMTVPFGVVQEEGGRVTRIKEKPVLTHRINLAVYVISPHILRHVPKNTPLDMPQFIEILIDNDYFISTFPFLEDWVDVGSVSELELAKTNYNPHKRPRLSMSRSF